MNLFDILPEKYFSLFSSKNKAVYATSLLTLYDLLSNDLIAISKNDFIKALKEKANVSLDRFDILADEDDYEIDDNTIIDTLSSKASFIVRRLEETGWIAINMDKTSLEETIILPPYTIVILKAFKDVISDEESPYSSLVHSTYSELKLEDEQQDDLLYVTLVRCYENTKKLKVELFTLSNSIKLFKAKLTKMYQTNDVLKDYFDVYKTKVLDRYYHPLKTFDSVAKFKRPIINILEKWLVNRDIRDKLVHQASLVNTQTPLHEIQNDVITKINYISDTYSELNNLIETIDNENSEYTKSSTNKILYLNNTDKTIKGHLENILKCYAKSVNNPKALRTILTKMQDSIYLYEQGYISSDSLTLPILRKYKEDASPLPLYEFNFANEEIMRDFLESTKDLYTDEKIYGFMERCFGNNDILYSKDIDLSTFDAFICLIFATIKKDNKDCFYDWELDKTNKQIPNGKYIIPNLIFVRKEKKNV